MLTFLYCEVNVVCIIILLLIYFSSRKNGTEPLDQKMFERFIFSVIAVLICDSAGWALNGRASETASIFMASFDSLYFVFGALAAYMWALYCMYKIDEDEMHLLRRAPLFVIPFFINFIAVMINMFTGWMFTIDSNGNYVRGNFIFIHILCCIFYLVWAFISSLRKAITVKSGIKNDYFYISVFSMIPVITGIIQEFFYGISIIWVSAAIATLMLFVYVQNHQISSDPLTGTNNRYRLTQYLDAALKSESDDSGLYLVLVNINDFKGINETYGHATGDNVLRSISNVLKTVCAGRSDFLARMTADKFVIVCRRKHEDDIGLVAKEITSGLSKYNNLKHRDYTVSLTVKTLECTEDDTLDSLLARSEAAFASEKKTAVRKTEKSDIKNK